MEDLELSEEYLENVLGGANINVVADKLGVSVEELQKLISRYPHNMREVSEQLGSKIEEEKKRSREELEEAVSKIHIDPEVRARRPESDIDLSDYQMLTPPIGKNFDNLSKKINDHNSFSSSILSYNDADPDGLLFKNEEKPQDLIEKFPIDYTILEDPIDYSSISLGSNEKDGLLSTKELIRSIDKIHFHNPDPIIRRDPKVDRTVKTLQDLLENPVEKIVLIDDSKDETFDDTLGHRHGL